MTTVPLSASPFSDAVPSATAPRTSRHFAKAGNSPARGERARMLGHLMQDKNFMREPFYGTVNTNVWTLAHLNAGTDFAARANDAAGTVARGTTDTASADAVVIYGARQFTGDNNCGLRVRFRTDVITTFQFEIGFVDVASTKTTNVCSDLDIPTIGNGAGDAVIVTGDTRQTLTTMTMVGVGSSAVASAWSTAGFKRGQDTVAPTPAAATWMEVWIQIAGQAAHSAVYDNTGTLLGEAHKAVGVNNTVVLFPYALFITRTTAAKNIDLDDFDVWADQAQ